MIIITTHKGSDFDALASLVAASLLYPGSKPVLPTSINENLKAFLSIHKVLFDIYFPRDIKTCFEYQLRSIPWSSDLAV